MNPLIKTFSRENNFKHRQVTVESFDVILRVCQFLDNKFA